MRPTRAGGSPTWTRSTRGARWRPPRGRRRATAPASATRTADRSGGTRAAAARRRYASRDPGWVSCLILEAAAEHRPAAGLLLPAVEDRGRCVLPWGVAGGGARGRDGGRYFLAGAAG